MADVKVRMRFAKRGNLRLLSHLDLVRVFERAFRRAALPVLFSEGFNPRPRMSIPLALPLGVEAWNEILEFRLAEDVPIESLSRRLQDALPIGLEVRAVECVAEFRKPARILAVYRVEGFELPLPAEGDLRDRWRRAGGGGAGTAPGGGGEGSTPGALAGVRSVSVEADGNTLYLEIEIVEGRGLRADAVAKALGLGEGPLRVVRADLRWEEGDAAARSEPPPSG